MGALLVSSLLGGCAAASAPPAAAPVSAPAPVATSPVSAPGTLLLSGDLRTPGSVTVAQLAARPQVTIEVEYRKGEGVEQRTEVGVPLSDLLPADSLATTDRKNDLLAFAVLAIGADGYAALVSYGEISPDFGDRGLLLSVSEDGKPLERPRLVVPGDVKGGRYVSDVVELRVIRAG